MKGGISFPFFKIPHGANNVGTNVLRNSGKWFGSVSIKVRLCLINAYENRYIWKCLMLFCSVLVESLDFFLK